MCDIQEYQKSLAELQILSARYEGVPGKEEDMDKIKDMISSLEYSIRLQNGNSGDVYRVRNKTLLFDPTILVYMASESFEDRLIEELDEQEQEFHENQKYRELLNPDLSFLTDIQYQTLQLMADGNKVKDTAAEFGVKPQTAGRNAQHGRKKTVGMTSIKQTFIEMDTIINSRSNAQSTVRKPKNSRANANQPTSYQMNLLEMA